MINTSSLSEYKNTLIQSGVLPSPEESKKQFWALENNWWKQIIDGHVHQHGKMVFDEGKHGKHVEPGYYNGIENASRFLTENFDRELDSEFYKEIHHLACAHFEKGNNNGILCSKKEMENFRVDPLQCSLKNDEFLQLCTEALYFLKTSAIFENTYNVFGEPSYEQRFSIAQRKLMENLGWQKPKEKSFVIQQQELNLAIKHAKNFLLDCKELIEIENQLVQISNNSFTDPSKCSEEVKNTIRKCAKLIHTFLEEKDDLMLILIGKIAKVGESIQNNLNANFDLLEKRLSVQPLLRCSFFENIYCPNSVLKKFLNKQISLHDLLKADVVKEFILNINYLKTQDSEIVTKKLLEEFNIKINELQKIAFEQLLKKDVATVKNEYQEKVLPLIAQLYEELEWAHPWIDGQGRTDLILLNGLLCREGFHPIILKEPYFSSGHSLELWIEYLKQGLNAYELEKQRDAFDV